MSVRDKSIPLLGRPGGGRPRKRSKEIEAIVLKAIELGAPFTLACAHAGICLDTFIDWRRKDPAFHAEVERVVADCALRRLQGIEKHGKENFAALSWLLERRHPELFGRPEIQLNLIQQNNVTESHLTINITGAEALEIERQAQPIRDEVSEMFRHYRPLQGSGEAGVSEIEASQVPVQEQEQLPITHHDGDEQSPVFWHCLVSARPERPVRRETAVFAIRAILVRLMGLRGHRAQIEFSDNPVTASDLFDTLERLCGGPAGWQLAQKLGGY